MADSVQYFQKRLIVHPHHFFLYRAVSSIRNSWANLYIPLSSFLHQPRFRRFIFREFPQQFKENETSYRPLSPKKIHTSEVLDAIFTPQCLELSSGQASLLVWLLGELSSLSRFFSSHLTRGMIIDDSLREEISSSTITHALPYSVLTSSSPPELAYRQYHQKVSAFSDCVSCPRLELRFLWGVARL